MRVVEPAMKLISLPTARSSTSNGPVLGMLNVPLPDSVDTPQDTIVLRYQDQVGLPGPCQFTKGYRIGINAVERLRTEPSSPSVYLEVDMALAMVAFNEHV